VNERYSSRPQDAALQTLVRILSPQAREAELDEGRPVELPEVVEVAQIGQTVSSLEEDVVPSYGEFTPQFVRRSSRAGKRCHPVQSRSVPGQSFLAEVGSGDERVFALRQGVEVNAVDLAQLLAQTTDIDPDSAWKSGPVHVSLLQVHPAVLPRQEDLRAGVGVQGGLERELELANLEDICLRPGSDEGATHISRYADLRIQPVEKTAALTRGFRLRDRVRLSGGSRCRRPKRRQLVHHLRRVLVLRPELHHDLFERIQPHPKRAELGEQ
jgi:hypothetical protein